MRKFENLIRVAQGRYNEFIQFMNQIDDDEINKSYENSTTLDIPREYIKEVFKELEKDCDDGKYILHAIDHDRAVYIGTIELANVVIIFDYEEHFDTKSHTFSAMCSNCIIDVSRNRGTVDIRLPRTKDLDKYELYDEKLSIASSIKLAKAQ